MKPTGALSCLERLAARITSRYLESAHTAPSSVQMASSDAGKSSGLLPSGAMMVTVTNNCARPVPGSPSVFKSSYETSEYRNSPGGTFIQSDSERRTPLGFEVE